MTLEILTNMKLVERNGKFAIKRWNWSILCYEYKDLTDSKHYWWASERNHTQYCWKDQDEVLSYYDTYLKLKSKNEVKDRVVLRLK